MLQGRNGSRREPRSDRFQNCRSSSPTTPNTNKKPSSCWTRSRTGSVTTVTAVLFQKLNRLLFDLAYWQPMAMLCKQYQAMRLGQALQLIASSVACKTG